MTRGQKLVTIAGTVSLMILLSTTACKSYTLQGTKLDGALVLTIDNFTTEEKENDRVVVKPFSHDGYLGYLFFQDLISGTIYYFKDPSIEKETFNQKQALRNYIQVRIEKKESINRYLTSEDIKRIEFSSSDISAIIERATNMGEETGGKQAVK